ncbi:MAG: coenzyme F420-0:L-glutamate ligase / coenzyme F420:gamma-L-glutamate ligase [Kosmotoga sp.]|nr:coenzyme F420-0:L-glutamate ligase / coenzyme F420:gamma-L-glutamate ligase [Kosmotoga sp.]
MSEQTVKGELRVIPISVSEAIVPEEARRTTAGEYLVNALKEKGIEVQDKDVFVLTSKLVSLFDGRTINLSTVTPSRKAKILGKLFHKDPREVELIMREGKVLAVIPFKKIAKNPAIWKRMLQFSANPEGTRQALDISTYVFVVNNHAAYLDDAGIDFSNSPPDYVTLLPKDPCASAKRIRKEIMDLTGKEVAVIITDTVSVLGRMGSQDIAIGYSGIDPITRKSGKEDLFGEPHLGGNDLVIDSMAGIAGLVMGQMNESTPATLIRGYDYEPEREDEEPKGMELIAYPKSMAFRSSVLTILTTVWFRIVNFFTFQKWPKDEEN